MKNVQSLQCDDDDDVGDVEKTRWKSRREFLKSQKFGNVSKVINSRHFITFVL